MSKRKRKARRPLEVTVVFEPSRLAAEYLSDAYAQVVPLRSLATSASQRAAHPSPPSSIESQRGEQV